MKYIAVLVAAVLLTAALPRQVPPTQFQLISVQTCSDCLLQWLCRIQSTDHKIWGTVLLSVAYTPVDVLEYNGKVFSYKGRPIPFANVNWHVDSLTQVKIYTAMRSGRPQASIDSIYAMWFRSQGH